MKQHENKNLKLLFGSLVLLLSTVVFATTCYQIDWEWCEDFYPGGINSNSPCEDECAGPFSRCGSGYYEYEILAPVCAESGYWDYETGGLLQVCADRYNCDKTDEICDDFGFTEYWCEQGDYETYLTSVSFYGLYNWCEQE